MILSNVVSVCTSQERWGCGGGGTVEGGRAWLYLNAFCMDGWSYNLIRRNIEGIQGKRNMFRVHCDQIRFPVFVLTPFNPLPFPILQWVWETKRSIHRERGHYRFFPVLLFYFRRVTLHGATIIGSLVLTKGWLTEEVTNCKSGTREGGWTITTEMKRDANSKYTKLVNSCEPVSWLVLLLFSTLQLYKNSIHEKLLTELTATRVHV